MNTMVIGIIIIAIVLTLVSGPLATLTVALAILGVIAFGGLVFKAIPNFFYRWKLRRKYPVRYATKEEAEEIRRNQRPRP